MCSMKDLLDAILRWLGKPELVPAEVGVEE